ncbi:MAG: translation initiation factor IF-2 [Planctomycetia bacterium]|nr:translation initiation factor IF-2 [Planctomycetia bacterium]
MTENLAEDKQQLKVRIFALAKELGMDSKVLIQHCNDAGIPVKASALASISPAERDVVLGYINSKSTKPAKSDVPVLPRDVPVEVAAKARPIKTIPTAPRTMAPVMRPLSSSKPLREPKEEPEEPAVLEQVVAPAAAPEVKDAVVEKVAVLEVLATPEVVPQSEVLGLPEVGAVDSDDGVIVDDPAVVGAHRREDYITPHGATPTKLREMRPIGSTGDMRPTGTVRKAKPNLPQLAAIPDAPVVKAKRDDRPAQKPDIKITADFDHTGPLAGRVSQVVEGKKSPVAPRKRMMTHEEEEAERTKGKGPGGVLVGTREERRQKRHTRVEIPADEDEDRPTRTRVRMRRPKTVTYGEHKTHAEVELPISLRSLSEAMGRPVKALMGILFKQNKMVGINDAIEEELALELSMELGVELTILREKDLEEELMETLKVIDAPENLVTRPPIVTILGHVDHGKTTLLDKIRSSNVAGGEAGGITQHIRAYQIEHNGHKVTFVDTPGHAAFGEMRARGANVTDVIVLVVAANDGVMPQTIECIAHAKASGATVVVAMNKIDLPDRNEQKLLSDLATHGLLVQEWGGEVEMVRTSGITGVGLDDLLELLLLTAEVHELKANPNRPAVGLCLEGFRDEGRGVLALMMVRQGTLRVGDIILCAGAHGRIRALYNDRDEEVSEAPPSTPVRVAGLDIMPNAGEQFFVMDDLDAAREIAEIRQQRGRSTTLSGRTRKRTLDDILNSDRENAIKDLPLIIKADTPGSIEALKHELAKFDHPEVRVNLLHAAVGGVNESDIYLASASGAIIVAFHVIADDRAVTLADKEGVDIRRYQIIYEVTDEIKVALEGLLTPEKRQVSTGRAIVLQTFSISRTGTIAGCRVLSGNIERNSRIRLIRDQKILNDYGIASLKRVKEDAREVREGMECGIRLEHFNDVKEGDLLEAYRIEEVKRTMD